MEHGELQVITKVLVSAAIALGAAGVVAAPASADNPNPFSNLSCSSCQQAPPERSPVVTDQLNQGIQAAETALLPGIQGQQ